MSIESDLKKIAAATEETNELLTQLLHKFSHIGQAVTTAPEAPKQPSVPAPAAVTHSTLDTPVVDAVAQQPAPVPPVSTQQAAMTPEELNNALVVEFQRLGGREAIDAAIREAGATTIADLPSSQYQVVLDKVRSL